ncbi:RUN and SH3 domain-containing protein 1 isoform X2 [Varanus komodoensis]|uniref:RUN and SH3 domain-containing protein 1 isoform X2 n=1 Tax=Varanus komodoensis TaxID=61221 RepID=UPI001CF7BC1A|nr:RUN and SH3 domain-containing protein 1 isoform X2 [Varanus komodoensis]
MPGREETGDRHFKEVRAPPTHPTQPQPLPFQPLLVHFSVVDGQPAEFPRPPSLCPSLDSVELASPGPTGPAFCPRLKTLSCEEVCLLASRQGQVFGTLSPEELFPIRLSPIGAHSPPARSALPFLDSPDLAVLFSPFFPRSRTFPALAFPPCQVPELPIGAPGPLDSQAGPAGPRSVSWGSMGTKESGPPEQLRHSQSFAGVPSTDHPWRADTDQVFTQLREQKKALLVAISASVDKIVAHFSTARNLVQKAQLGDSRLSPDVGYLILNTLCPALRALVSDGLKPFQKDVITGQRPSSPWSVVEASAKPGPQARSLNALYWRVSRLAPLRSNQQRFHAFILGLLNMKQLEQWFSHLQRNSELISALYLPTAFLVLSQGFCRRWADELLLLLQPLSMLTFQLDLLFEHHHLSLDIRPMPRQAATPPEPPPSFRQAAGPRRPDFSRCQVPLVRQEDGPLAQSSPLHQPPLHQRLLQWGGRLTHTLRGHEPGPMPEPCTQAVQRETEDKPWSWREQLGWPSEACGSSSASKQEGFPYTHWTKLRMALGEVIKEAHGGTGEAAASSGTLPPTPSPGEGRPRKASASKVAGHSPGAEPRRKLAATTLGTVEAEEAEGTPEGGEAPGGGKATWLGWLFGANYPGASSEPSLSAPKPSRRPSSWLPPTMNVLALVMKTAPTEKNWQEESWEHSGPDPLQAYRAVRALCDHAGSGAGHLSFRKGDVLQVLDTVDEDWIQCCHGDRKGLVPIGYTSLIL